jgi:hypothetical protein
MQSPLRACDCISSGRFDRVASTTLCLRVPDVGLDERQVLPGQLDPSQLTHLDRHYRTNSATEERRCDRSAWWRDQRVEDDRCTTPPHHSRRPMTPPPVTDPHRQSARFRRSRGSDVKTQQWFNLSAPGLDNPAMTAAGVNAAG